MSTEVLTQNLTAGVKATFGSGKVFLIASATGPVNIVATQIGNSNKTRRFTGVPSGFKFTADNDADGFSTLEVTSPTTQAFTIAVGDDDIAFSNAVTVSGLVATQDTPATVVAGSTKVTAAATASLFAANASRRRITITWDPTTAANTVIYLRVAGGARFGAIQPGQSVQINGTYAVDYEAAAAGDNLLIAEET
jgi:hypothetical protein